MTDDKIKAQLQERALIDYPLGTVYVPLGMNGNPSRQHAKAVVDRSPTAMKVGNKWYVDVGISWCYVNGTWSEILSPAPGKTEDNYLTFN